MIVQFKKHWREYLIEAWALGMFMVSACVFVILIEHPDFMIRELVPNNFIRRLFIGAAMGVTAILLIHSPWGKQSGAQMNPAVTLSFLYLGKIEKTDAFFYIIFQFIGGYLGVAIFQFWIHDIVADGSVNFVATIPPEKGVTTAFILEFALAFGLFLMVLITSNTKSLENFTAYFVGILLTLFIAIEAPYSGMSINPARTLGSAIPALRFDALWLYFLAPITGMLSAAILYKKTIGSKKFECSMGANNINCKTYKH